MATFLEMEKSFKENLTKNNLAYVTIPTEKEMKKIYNLWINDIFDEPETSIELLYFGSYYNHIKSNYELTKKYLLMAIELNCLYAMNSLGVYYHLKEQNYDEMKKYYLMAIEHKHPRAMNNLANYYRCIENNYDEMKKYYLMAINLGDPFSMINFGRYFELVEKNHKEAKKYYLMAIEHKSKEPTDFLANLYGGQNKTTKALYYYSMSGHIEEVNRKLLAIVAQDLDIDKYFYNSLPYLKDIEKDIKIPKALKVIITLYNKEIDVLENAFKYAPGQKGYDEALEDFKNQLASA